MSEKRTLEQLHDTCDKAQQILALTSDGDDLAPEHLKLVEMAVNGFLNDAGVKAFEDLYVQCKAGPYKKPWFHDIENLTIDHIGYVYWKEKRVEHYNLGWCWTAGAKKQAEELAARCRLLEERGEPVRL